MCIAIRDFFQAIFFACVAVTVALFFLLFLPATAHAAVVTWDGGGGVDTNWGTCANWSGNTCPTSSDIATFDATSTNNSTIAVTLTGATAPAGIDINTGYTGTITANTGVAITVGTSNFDQATGTFNGGDAAHTFNGGLVLSGGTFTSTSGTLSVQGSWTHTVGGTFSHNNGTVRFINAADTTIDVNTTESFYNVTEEKTTNWQTILATGDTATINGTLTLTDGRLMSVASTSIWDLKGVISVGTNWDSGTANLKFSGTSDQSLTLVNTASWDPIGGLTIDKATGTFTLGSALTLDGGGTAANVTVTQGAFNLNGFALRCNDFTLTSGTFTSGAVSVDVDDDLTVSAGTWNASTGLTIVGGDLTVSTGATFNDNSGSFTFDTTADATMNVDVSETFYDLTINKAAYLATITSGDTLTVTNTLSLTDGRFGTGTIDMQGTTTTVASTYDSGTAVLKFSGTGTQTLTMQHASVNNFNGNVIIDKSGGSLTLASALTLDDGGQTFTLTNGTFSTGNFNLSTMAYSQTNGTFNGGSSTTVDINGTFTLSGGTYNAATGTTQFGENYTHNAGGTFNHSNGTAKFDTTIDRTYDVATSETFYNLTLDKGGSIGTIATGDTFIALNTFTCTDGRFITGTIDLRGDATFGSLCDYTTSPVTITGTGDQTITNSMTDKLAGGVTVNKLSGSVYLGANWSNNSGTFTMTNGTMYLRDSGATNNYTFTVSAYSQGGGTFNGGSSTTVDVNGAFTLSGGTYNATTGTTQLGDAFTHTAGGTFTHSNGTVKFDTAADKTYNVATSETFYNVTLDKGGFLATIATGDTLVVLNTFICTDGRFGTGSLDLRGDVTINSLCDSTTAPITLTGSNTQTFTLNATTIDADFTVNKSGGQVNQSGTFTLDCTNCDFTIQEGTYDLNGSNLSVTAGGTEKIVVETGGNLQLQGSETIAADSASYPQLDSGSTVTYDSGSSVTLKDYTYHHLTIAGTTDVLFTLAANEVVAGNVTITSGTLNLGGKNLTVSGTFTNDDTLRLQGLETISLTQDTTSGSWVYVGNDDGSADARTIKDFGVGVDYYNLRINDTSVTKDTYALGANVDIDGTLRVSSGALSQGTYTIDTAGINVDGGTLTGGSGAITMNGATGVTISSGTFTSTSNTLTVTGGWTHTAGGTFTHNSGTVSFTGSAATVDVATSETFSGLTISKTDGQTLTVASGDTLIAAGTLTLTDGTWGTGNVQAQGNVAVPSTWDAGGSGTLEFAGSGTQTFDLTGAVAAFDNPVNVNKSGGSLTLASAYTLDHANADFTVTLGTFSTGNFAMTTSAGSDIAVNGGIVNAGSSTMTIAGALSVGGGTYNGNTSSGTISGAFTLSSGAYNGNTSTPTFSSSLTISGGTFTASSGTTTVASGFTHTAGGTFTHNSGTVAFTGNSSTVDVTTSETFSGLTINKTDGQTLTVASGDTLIATGTLTLTDGIWGTGNIQAQGNVAVSLTWDAGGSGTLEFAGTGVQTFDLTGAVAAFDNSVNVNKSGGSLTLASAYTLDHANADFTVTLGTFSTGGYAMTTSAGSDIAVNGGIFNTSTSTMTIAGVLTVAGGTYNGNDSTPTFSGAFTLSSGAYNGSSNGDTFSGGLTISGGTLTASDATTTVSSGWTHTAGGTFTHNGGTVQFTGNAATVDVATSETFSGLTINKNNAQTLTIASGDTLVAVGTLTLTNGAAGTGTLEPQGAVTVGAGYDGGNAPLKFSGTSAQTFTLTGATDKYDGDIEIAKGSNTVSLGSDLVMNAAGQDLTMTSGTLSTTGTHYGLTVAGNVAANGGTLTLNGSTVDLNGNIVLAGGVVNASTATTTLAGNFTLTSGTFTHNSGTVSLDGASQQIVGTVTFGNLTKTVASAATLTFPASTITTIAGTLNLQGADDQLLSLRSSVSGTKATITPVMVTAPNYLDVKDIFITTTTRCITSTQGCVDSGNTQGWTFRSSGGVTAAPSSGAGAVRSIRILSPNGGESFIPGERVDIAWTSTGGIALVNLYYSDDDGATWQTLAENYTNVDTYAWFAADESTTSGVLKIEGTDTIVSMATDTTDALFTITAESEVSTDDEEVDAPVVLTPEQAAEAVVITERLEAFPRSVTVHGLVKLPNDGNPLTDVDSAVYYVGADGKRHAFPNPSVYFSWFCDFSGVKEISARDLAALEFGSNITYRPGYKMVKFQTSPKVYAVDQLGVLRWVATEELARGIYGDAWVRRIDDISDAFFGNYVFGSPILAASDFDPDQKQADVVYPSDNMEIPGYVASSPQALVCDE